MTIHADFDERLRGRLQTQLRMAQDCLRRASDGSDRSLTSVQAKQYVAAQLSQASEAVNNAVLALEALCPKAAE
jgi:hypothetical protein